MGKITIKFKTIEAMKASPGVVETTNWYGDKILECRPYPSFPLGWAYILCGKEYDVIEENPVVVGIRVSGWMVESKELRFNELYERLK